MIIKITFENIWNEFVYWRKAGNDRFAFAYIRRYITPLQWRILIADLVKFNYPDVMPGDIIVAPDEDFLWPIDVDDLLEID